MADIKKSMYKPKEENIQKLREYLKKQEHLNIINIIKNADNQKL